MKGYKRVFNCYSAWDYTREIEDLNKMSEKGWQLIKGGLFSNYYKKNEDIRYRYQLDFNTKIEDMGRYIEIFHEQGWEYVNSTWNGWHYFRKIYDPALDGEEFEIYNDSQSLQEMQNKWKRIAIGASVILWLFVLLEGLVLFRSYSLPIALITLTLLIEALVITRGAYVMRNLQRADGHKRSWNGMPLFMTVLVLGLASSLVFLHLRNTTGINTKAQSYAAISSIVKEGVSVNWSDVKLNYPDFYSFEVEGTATSPITLSLVNRDTGNIEYQIRLDQSKAKEGKKFRERKYLFLKPGNYSIYGSDFAGGGFDMHVSLR